MAIKRTTNKKTVEKNKPRKFVREPLKKQTRKNEVNERRIHRNKLRRPNKKYEEIENLSTGTKSVEKKPTHKKVIPKKITTKKIAEEKKLIEKDKTVKQVEKKKTVTTLAKNNTAPKNIISANNKKVLEIKDLSVQYKMGEGLHFNALRNISFDIRKGEVVGLVGESGSGKSTTAKSILGLADHATGYVKINGELVPNRSKDIKGRVNKWLASKVQMIFQDAKSSLNPREKVYSVIVEGAKNQKLYQKSKDANKVIIADDFLKKNKHLENSKGYKLFTAELKKLRLELEAKAKYEEDYSRIFTTYDDQRVVVRGVVSRKKADINTFKTSYKIFTTSGYNGKTADISFNDKSAVKFRPGQVQKSKLKHRRTKMALDVAMREKLEKDIIVINKKYEKDYARENAKFKIAKEEFKKSKKEYHKEYKDRLNEIRKQFNKEVNEAEKCKDTRESKDIFVRFHNYKKEHKGELNKKEFYRRLVKEVMEKVSISPEHINRYPGEFSGGQAQRIAIARTLAMKSELIIADEPISALDVSIQAQVINLLKKIIKDEKLTVMFIAHDLQVVRYISNRILVMYKGEIIEKGDSQELYKNPIHPYTKTLINAVPSIDNPDRIRKSKQYIPEHIEDFTNLREVKKQWYKINDKHEIYGTATQIRKWKRDSKNNK